MIGHTRQRYLSRAAIGIALVIGACGTPAVDSTPSVSDVQASGQPTDAVSPSMSGTPSPSVAPEGPVGVGTTIQVMVDTLRVREAPGTDATIVARLARDVTAVVTAGPMEADGYTWFEVETSAGAGWVADGDGQEAWIVAAPPLEAAELAFRFRVMCDVQPPLVPPLLTVTTDREVVMASQPSDGGWRTGRLTPAAFGDLMALLDHPALAESARYVPVRRPEAGEPPGHGLCVFEFTFGPPEDRVQVTSVSWFGDEEEAMFYEPSPERKALDELAQRLQEPGLLTDAAWESPPGTYEADAFLAWIQTDAGPSPPGVPAADDLDVLGDLSTFGVPASIGRCGYLDRDEVEELAEAFAGSEAPLDPLAVSYLTAAAEPGPASIIVSPIMPDAYPTCGSLNR